MNTVSGRVRLGNTGVGLGDLLVVVYDADPDTRPEETLPAGADVTLADWPVGIGDRIGSTLTDADGLFELTYEDSEFQVRGAEERRPDLLLYVLAYEEPDAPTGGPLLFGPSRVRHNAGRHEQFLIQVNEDVIAKVGLPLPGAAPLDTASPDHLVDRFKQGVDRAAELYAGRQGAEQARVSAAHDVLAPFHETLAPAIRARLSRRPEGSEAERFVGAGQSVAAATLAAIRDDLVTVANPAGRPARAQIALTDEQRGKLQAALAQDGTIDGEALDAIVGAPARPASLHREDVLARFVRQPSPLEAECARVLDQAAPGVTPTNGSQPATTASGATADVDVKGHVGRLIETLTAPEEEVLAGLETRADREGVASDIGRLAFAPNPADTPAYYDFHQLQIAFRHTWQEVIDEGLLELAEDAYQHIVELGGKPAALVADPIRGLRKEARLVLSAQASIPDSPPPAAETRARSGPVVRDHRGGPTVRDHRGEGVSVVPPRLDPNAASDPATRLPAILAELEQRLRGQYAFTTYAANRQERSVNFGLLTHYTQRWEPLAYQAGPLARTITLAPKETRRFSKKLVTHRKRADKEMQNQVRSEREESDKTTRAEEDIVRRAATKTNFSLTSKGTMQIPLGDASMGAEMTSAFSREAAKSSEATKKAFHEAVFKAAHEYKSEHSVEVNTEQSEDLEVVESGEITNPNDELAVTFLFYELQRRYRISEQLTRLTPVVFVAQEVPRPDEIDEAWLITHDWILRRVLLDDSFRPALDLVTQNIIGEQVALEELRANIQQQRAIIAQLGQELDAVRSRLDAYRNLGERSLLGSQRSGGGSVLSDIPLVGGALDAVEHSIQTAASDVGGFLFGDGSADPGTSRADALKDAVDRTAEDERDALYRLDREVSALNALMETYTKAVAEHLNHRAQVARLRAHVVDNVLYYMQAIWSHEPDDQRFFRLHETPVPTLQAASRTYRFGALEPNRASLASVAHHRLAVDGRAPMELFDCDLNVAVDPALKTAPLAELAELDTLLGFKGNYMIFPLRDSNALTDYMMAPYVIAGIEELTDPDDLANVTLEDFAAYVVSLKRDLGATEFDALRPQLTDQYRRLLSDPRRGGEVIEIPTDSLFIEALPASVSLLETYKAEHRAIDVKKVQAEVRKLELENLRLAARILTDQLEDPDVDKQVRIQGTVAPVVVDPDP